MTELRVAYPGIGSRFMLVWWTDDDRHHVVLGRSIAALLVTARHIVQEHGDYVRFKEVREIEMATPGPTFVAAVERILHEHRVNNFLFEVLSEVSALVDQGEPLPAPFALCKARVRKDDLKHYRCERCHTRVRIGMTNEKLYETYFARWREVYGPSPYEGRRESKLVPPRAPEAPDDEVLWCALEDFGHHQEGVVLTSAQPEDAARERVLFYFRELARLDLTPFQTMFEEAKAESDRLRAENEAHAEARRDEKMRVKLARVRAFFAQGELS